MATRVVVLLGGGGAKAAAHLGAARALREAGITPIHWIGTSMGSVIAATMAQGDDPDSVLERFKAAKRHDLLVVDKVALLRGVWAKALLKPAPFRATLERIVSARSFGELRTPCTLTAVEVNTGREVAFGAGGEDAPLLDVLMAACALPPYFPAVSVNGRECFDGGMRAVVPLHQADRIDCDLVVAIDTGPGFDEVGEPLRVPPPLVAPSDAAIGWLMAGTTQLIRERWQQRVGGPRLIWLRPVNDRGATFSMERIPAYADAGYAAMHQALGALG